ncbi:MAG: antitoxin CptB [Gammaproteobacteria bacterium]|jgi:antitoxin CptB
MDEQSATGELPRDALLLRRKRALYRAQYRGTKEMDWMVGRYAADKLDAMSGSELETFEVFLQVGDPEINAWLLADVACEEPQFAALINDIRAFHSLV